MIRFCFKTACRCCALLALAPIVAAAQVAPATIGVLLAAGNRQLALGHLPEAEQQLRAALRLDSGAAEVHFVLGMVLFRENRPTESLAEYTAGASGRTPNANDLITVASNYILLKSFPDAEKWLRYAIQIDPQNGRGWYLLGRTQYNEDRAEDARRSFEHCLTLSPREVRAEYNLGLAYEKLQRPTEALAAYRTAIQWQAGQALQDPQPFLNLGTLLLTQGQTAHALAALQSAVRYAPDNPLAQQELGRALEAQGRYEDAIPPLRRAALLSPTSQQPHFFLARVLRRLGRNDEATAEYAIVSKLLGSHSDTPTPNINQ